MWAAGAAADHSSARVHGVIARSTCAVTSGQHYSWSRARSISIWQLKKRSYRANIDMTHISMQLDAYESDDGNNAGHLEWVIVMYRANIDILAQIGIDSCISQGTFS